MSYLLLNGYFADFSGLFTKYVFALATLNHPQNKKVLIYKYKKNYIF